ncbi:arsenate reductase [Pontixanthobacter sp.]|uniref:arsenate reductase n=1 Tax=Pontixanthobacter sp. TaxID=2792078 RepID=UPI003C7CC05B
MTTITVYGIPGCDTIKKARTWLDAHGIAYTFHDYKKEGADADRLSAWVDAKGVDVVLNKRGTAFRKLGSADKNAIDAPKAVTLMTDNPSMIKRPVAEYANGCGGGLLVGFKEDEWSAALL